MIKYYIVETLGYANGKEERNSWVDNIEWVFADLCDEHTVLFPYEDHPNPTKDEITLMLSNNEVVELKWQFRNHEWEAPSYKHITILTKSNYINVHKAQMNRLEKNHKDILAKLNGEK